MSYSTLKNAEIAEKIDWIAYSQGVNLEWEFPDYIDRHWKEISPIRFYDHGEENKQGVKRYWSHDHPEQGRRVVLAGQSSATLRENQFDFLQWVNTTDRKATRIDYAIDILHSRFTPRVVRRHLLAGEAVTHALSLLTTGELIKNGDTQYIGRKTSETYTRIYDKATEQKVDFQWTRVETVYQGERAKPSLAAYCECKSTRPLITRHIDFPEWNDWLRIMSSDVVEFSMPQHETATRAWLLGQVAQAMAKELARDEDHIFWFDFQNAVKRELDTIEEKMKEEYLYRH